MRATKSDRTEVTTLRRGGLATTSIFALVFLLPSSAQASTSARVSSSPLDWYRVDTWRQRDGLPSPTVQSLLQDHRGYIVLGMHGAIARFDGVRFTPIEVTQALLPGQQVRSLREDADGTLWAATLSQGLLRIGNGKVRYFTVRDGLPANNVADVCRDTRGVLWVGTTAGVVSMLGEQITALPVGRDGGTVASLACATDGSVWVAPGDAAAWRMVDGHRVPFPSEGALANFAVNHVYENSRKQIFFGFTGGGIARLDGTSVTRFAAEQGLTPHRVMSILEDRSGKLWVATWGGGLSQWTGKSFVSIGVQEGLGSDNVTWLRQDNQDNVWAGTTGGLTRVTERPFRSLSTRNGVTGPLFGPVSQSQDGTLWLGTDGGGVLRIVGNKQTRITTNEGLLSNQVTALAIRRDGTVLVGGPNGPSVVPAGQDQARPLEARLTGRQVGVFVDSDDRVWLFGWRVPLSLWHEGQSDILRGPEEADPKVQLLAEDNAKVLWAAADHELFRINESKAKLDSVADVSARITGLTAATDGSLFIATEKQLLRRLANGQVVPMAIPAPWAAGSIILAEGADAIWVASRVGLMRFETATRQLLQWNAYDWLRGPDLTYPGTPRAVRGAGTNLLFAATEELVIVDPTRLKTQRESPAVVIESARADGHAIDADHPEVAAGARRIDFAFTALEYRSPHAVNFRFRLDGFDRGWNQAGARRTASYTNLPPGRFEFRVSASNETGTWNASEARLAFRIAPHIYQRRLFLLALLLLVAAVIPGTLHWIRLRRVRARFATLTEERNRIARELHDTLEQGFTGAMLHLKAAELEAKALPKFHEHLHAVRAIVRHMHADTRHHIWDLRGRGHTHADLATALAATLAQAQAATGLVTRFEMHGTARPLAAEIESALLRIAQEALTNLQKHAGATQAYVSLHFGAAEVTLRVADNGRGFEPEARAGVREGLGLVGMRERALRIGAKFTITSAANQGTTISVTAHG